MSGNDKLNSQIAKAVEAERARHVELGFDRANDEMKGPEVLMGWAINYRDQGKYVEALSILKARDELFQIPEHNVVDS